MKLIIIHNSENASTGGNSSLLRLVASDESIAAVIFDGLGRTLSGSHGGRTILAVPQEWGIGHMLRRDEIIAYGEHVPVGAGQLPGVKRDPWIAISNGRYVTQIDGSLLERLLSADRADVVAVSADSTLLASHERIRFTTEGKVAGFRRLYADTAELAAIPSDWPHHLLVRTDAFDRIRGGDALPRSFAAALDMFRSNGLTTRAVNVGGTVTDLETEDGLLQFLLAGPGLVRSVPPIREAAEDGKNTAGARASQVLRKPRLVGKVMVGTGVRIDPGATIIGPTIIGREAQVEQGALISCSIIGARVRVEKNDLVHNRVLLGSQTRRELSTAASGNTTRPVCIGLRPSGPDRMKTAFRAWPRLSYARCTKRIADCIGAAIVLILFAPIIPIVALAIKLTSPGPVFFKDRRQGLHGRLFGCLKFRTMRVGADKIQEQLRVASQVDGPQFKIENDPRISAVGRFLRATYIDEIPQFINVLLGQMSIVGPRPSPESENRLCPSWRDARLSVRPGITGLWQVSRTRQPMKDFQEWIYYDTKYVRDLSLPTDLWICWLTFRKMVWQFIDQF